MNRRTVLKGGLVLAATSHTVAVGPELADPVVSIDAFLAKAVPNEVVRYHSMALMEALAAIRPDLYWATLTDINLDHVFIVGRDRQHVEGGAA